MGMSMENKPLTGICWQPGSPSCQRTAAISETKPATYSSEWPYIKHAVCAHVHTQTQAVSQALTACFHHAEITPSFLKE